MHALDERDVVRRPVVPVLRAVVAVVHQVLLLRLQRRSGGHQHRQVADQRCQLGQQPPGGNRGLVVSQGRL